MAFVWVAVFGSYAAIMLRVPHGKGLLLGAVLVAIAADIVRLRASGGGSGRGRLPRASAPARRWRGSSGA